MKEYLFQIIFNNKIIRYEILKYITSIQDLFILISTSTINKQLITESLEQLTLTADFSHPQSKILIPILKHLKSLHKLILFSPDDECLRSIGFVDILEIHNGIIEQKETVQHLVNIIRNDIIINRIYHHSDKFCSLYPLTIKHKELEYLCLNSSTELVEIDFNLIISITNHVTQKITSRIIDKASHEQFELFFKSKIFSNLKEINMKSNRECYLILNDEILKNLASGTNCGVEVLKLSGWKLISDEGLIHFKDTVKVLWLKSIGTYRVTDKFLPQFTKLEELRVLGCGNVYMKGIDILCRGGKLKSLHLDYLGEELSYEALSNLNTLRVVSKDANSIRYEPPGTPLITHLYIYQYSDIDFSLGYSNLQVLDVNTYGSRLHSPEFINNLFKDRNPSIGPFKHFALYYSEVGDESLQYLIGTRSIKIIMDNSITSKGISYLDGVERILFRSCENIDDDSMKYLWNASEVTIIDCPKITEKGYSQLRHVKHLTISSYKFPHSAFQHFSSIDKLEIINLSKFEKELSYLETYRKYFKISFYDVGYTKGIERRKFEDDSHTLSHDIVQKYLTTVKSIRIVDDPNFLSFQSIQYLISKGVTFDHFNKNKTKGFFDYK